MEMLDDCNTVFCDQPANEFVLGVYHRALDCPFRPSDFLLALPVGRAAVFFVEFPLFAYRMVALIGYIKRVHRQILQGRDVTGDAKPRSTPMQSSG